jgi:protein O-GlcNAc transferase
MPTTAESVQAALRLHQAGDLGQAEAIYRAVLAQDPNQVDCLHYLGVIAHQSGRNDIAVELIGRALKRRPGSGEAQLHMANALASLGRHDEAMRRYKRALALRPKDANTRYNYAGFLRMMDRLDEAAAQYRLAIALKPDWTSHLQLGNLLVTQGKFDEGVSCYKRALALQPDHVGAHNNLGNALKSLHRLDEAVEQYQLAIAQKPDYPDAHGNLGNALSELGRNDEAAECHERAMALNPDHAVFRSGLLLSLSYRSDVTPAALLATHRLWGARHAPALSLLPPRPRDPAEGRRLRVGYVSPDLRAHSVAYFMAPLLAAHDRERFEIFCYADGGRPDDMTARLAAATEHWVPIYGSDDDGVIERIRGDGIDILVDLAGHTAYNRMPLFGRKPAPVQMSWLGYPSTTGIAAIDYRITDWVADPAGAEAGYSEALLRLPRCFVCYGPIAEAGPVAPPPSHQSGHVTFGSFNVLAKMSAQVTTLWAHVLRAVPDSRLLLKASAFGAASACERILAAFAAEGIDRARIVLVPWSASQRDHLALYGKIDIALDPFPYNGTTTTCEALWMGVPVVTLRGDRHAGRVGASLLGAVGSPGLIAETPDGYITIASTLARDGDRLAQIRSGLRDRMLTSPLCNAGEFARALENAYRAAWSDDA